MQTITTVLAAMTACARARDIDGLMALYHPSARAFDFGMGDNTGIGTVGIEQIRAHCEQGYAGVDDDGSFGYTYIIERLIEAGDVACCFGVEHVTGKQGGNTFQATALATYIFQQFDGRWLIVHQHLSALQHGEKA